MPPKFTPKKVKITFFNHPKFTPKKVKLTFINLPKFTPKKVRSTFVDQPKFCVSITFRRYIFSQGEDMFFLAAIKDRCLCKNFHKIPLFGFIFF